jgi:lipopolysaccharide transport system ATP-binding protein
MSKTVIKVENISKYYRLGIVNTGTLKDDIKLWWAKKRGREEDFYKIGEGRATSSDYMWAVKDISFEVKQGEVLGIIGKNGAGKSTLLKILSRVTSQTSGEIKVKGRIASLLEVGTGFHPELTGRENVFLNGAILGMRKEEIKKKFDEILDFSGVEKYIDTPVKRYSSGMYVRLAFAVAAHLESEILILDEVLAVGDAEFQKKCLGKMGKVSKDEGRTVLFVSHGMKSVRTLCSRGVLLENGFVKMDGRIDEVTDAYMSRDFKLSETIPESASSSCNGQAKFRKIQVVSASNESLSELFFRQSASIVLELEVFEQINSAYVSIIINSSDGDPVIFSTHGPGYQPRDFTPGVHLIKIEFDVVFMPKKYFITLSMATADKGASIDYVENVYSFTVDSIGFEKGSDYPWQTVHGFIEPKTKWTFELK